MHIFQFEDPKVKKNNRKFGQIFISGHFNPAHVRGYLINHNKQKEKLIA